MEQEKEQEKEQRALHAPVFSDSAPFTFTMSPPPPTVESKQEEPPMAIDKAVRSTDHQPISPKALRKIYSRRRHRQQQQQQQMTRRSFDDEDDSQETTTINGGGAWLTESETEEQKTESDRRVVQQRTNERLQMHRDLPYVISGYLQLGFNIFMVGTVLVIVVNVLLTIRRDVNSKVQEYSSEILHEIATCSKQYADNQCDPLMRVPAMEPLCVAWESCMHRDPTKVGRAKVSAETLAEIVNGFIDPISFKTMLFFVLLFVGTLLVSNFAFGAYRQNRVQKQHVRGRQTLHVMPPLQQQQQQPKRSQNQQPRRRRALPANGNTAAALLPPPPPSSY
ncbi:hypothetical protein LPJ59_001046 [Coemansia sp. RSA 2399]|nr:hypothetical protein LPJ59_001046 [Coemansia sp. RSA 2399]